MERYTRSGWVGFDPSSYLTGTGGEEGGRRAAVAAIRTRRSPTGLGSAKGTRFGFGGARRGRLWFV